MWTAERTELTYDANEWKNEDAEWRHDMVSGHVIKRVEQIEKYWESTVFLQHIHEGQLESIKPLVQLSLAEGLGR